MQNYSQTKKLECALASSEQLIKLFTKEKESTWTQTAEDATIKSLFNNQVIVNM